MVGHHVSREQITVSSSEKTLTVAKVNTADNNGRLRTVYAEIDVQDDDIYVTFEGTTPSASVGEKWYDGQKYRVWGIHNLLNVRFIRVSTDAVIEVNYWGDK